MTTEPGRAGPALAASDTRESRAVRCFVAGRVQGVWYRAAAAERARELSLRGYVRNRTDGRVEIVLAGDGAAVSAMIGWLWQGPDAARVSGVAVETCTDDGLPAAFELAPTL